MTRSTSDKDAKKAYVNALWLFGHEPDNLSYMEAVVRNAGRLRAENAAKWATGVYTKALEANAKAGTKQFQSLCQLTEELGDRAGARGEVAFGVEVYQMGVEVVQLWRRRTAKDPAADNSLKQISTKLTILKGKYDKGEGYRGSIVDSEEQEALHDKHRTVQGDDRVDQLIARAAAAFQANPDKAGVLREYTDLLCRREREEEETTAIGLLVGEFKRTNDYRWKQLADDVRIKQLGRAAREAAKGGQEEQAKQARIDQLRFELKVFKDRSELLSVGPAVEIRVGHPPVQRGPVRRRDSAVPAGPIGPEEPGILRGVPGAMLPPQGSITTRRSRPWRRRFGTSTGRMRIWARAFTTGWRGPRRPGATSRRLGKPTARSCKWTTPTGTFVLDWMPCRRDSQRKNEPLTGETTCRILQTPPNE